MRIVIALAAALLLAVLPARADFDVVASIKPVHSLVAAVMEGAGEPGLLVEGAASPHSYSLKPSQARRLQNADVIFWIGENLETFLEKPVGTIAAQAKSVELIHAAGLQTLQFGHGGDEEHDAEHQEDEGHDGHHHEGTDPHIWLDPLNARAAVAEIETVLAQADPDNAALYAKNAAALSARLDTLNTEIAGKLAPVGNVPFVTFHDGYRYFERRFGLHSAGSLTVSPDVSPGAEHIAEIHALIGSAGAKCVFAEPQFKSSLIAVVTEGTDARSAELDPLGASLEPGPDLYFELMNAMADAFADCLGG